MIRNSGLDVCALHVVAALAVLGALLFTQIDAGRKLVPDSTSPVV